LESEFLWGKAEFEKAGELAFQVLRLSKGKPGYEVIYATGLSIRAMIFNSLDQYQKSIEQFKVAIEETKKTELKSKVGDVMNNLAVVYANYGYEEGHPEYYDSALMYLYSLEPEVNSSWDGYRNSKIMIGQILSIQGKFEEATKTLLEAREIEETHKLPVNVALIGAISFNYYNQNEFEKAEQFLLKGLKESIEKGKLDERKSFLQNISDLYKRQERYEEAMEYQNKMYALKDSIKGINQLNNLAELEMKYETEQKEQAIKVLEGEKRLAETQRVFFIIASVLLLSVVGLVFYQFRQRNKYAKVVERKNEQLSELMSAKQKVFGVIAHDLKNPLSAFSNMSSVLAENIDSFTKDEIRVFLEKFVKSSGDLRNLLNNLLQWSLSETGMLKMNPETFRVSELANQAIQPLRDYAQTKGIAVEMQLIDDQVMADRKMIETVIRNLVSNALKFTETGGKVAVRTDKNEEGIKIEVTDTGVGMEAEELQSLFDVKKDVSQIGDHQEKGTGIGLLLCKELVEKNGGKIWVESEKGKGSRFYFTIPKAA